MGKIILVRHGQTSFNAEKLYFGKLDPSLNEKGIEQAKKAKEKLEKAAYDYDEVHSSPLLRAKETAEWIVSKKREIHLDARLEELNFGIFEGLTLKEIQETYPEQYQKSVEHWKTYNYETGENLEMLQQRAVDYLFSLDFDKNHLVVTHWGVICAFLSYIFSNSLDAYWKFKVLNGGIVVLDVRENFPVLEAFL